MYAMCVIYNDDKPSANCLLLKGTRGDGAYQYI